MAPIFLPPPGAPHKAYELEQALARPDELPAWLDAEQAKLDRARGLLTGDPEQAAMLAALELWGKALVAARQAPGEEALRQAARFDAELGAVLQREWELTRTQVELKQQELRWAGFQPPPPRPRPA